MRNLSETQSPQPGRRGLSDPSNEWGRAGREREARFALDETTFHDIRLYLELRAKNAATPAGLAAAWDRFYDRYTPRIRAYLRKSGLTEADREDCLQSVWGDVVARWPSLAYDPVRGRLSTWLIAIARNRSIDILRRRRRSSEWTVEADDLVDPGPDPCQASECRITQARVRSVLAELAGRVSPLNYQVLHLRMVEGLRGAEVAEALGLTADQVRFRLHRVKNEFRELFDRSLSSERS